MVASAKCDAAVRRWLMAIMTMHQLAIMSLPRIDIPGAQHFLRSPNNLILRFSAQKHFQNGSKTVPENCSASGSDYQIWDLSQMEFLSILSTWWFSISTSCLGSCKLIFEVWSAMPCDVHGTERRKRSRWSSVVCNRGAKPSLGSFKACSMYSQKWNVCRLAALYCKHHLPIAEHCLVHIYGTR